jgi:hypothetical protein
MSQSSGSRFSLSERTIKCQVQVESGQRYVITIKEEYLRAHLAQTVGSTHSLSQLKDIFFKYGPFIKKTVRRWSAALNGVMHQREADLPHRHTGWQ